MSIVPVSQVRNFTIMGHSGSGKTTLTDAIAYKLGLNDRMGLVDNGTSISDTHDEEKNRKVSIFASTFTSDYTLQGDTYRLVFTDTPGAPGFYGELRGAIRASDFALITVDAASGVEAGTIRSWHACVSHGLSAIAFVITGLDKDNTSFSKTVKAIRDAFGKGCCPITAQTAPGTISNILDTDELPNELAEIRTYLAESAAETSESLMDEYFAQGTLPAEKIRAGLKGGITDGTIHPIYAACALKGEGITEMLSSICRLLPFPGRRIFTDNEGNEIVADKEAPVIGQIWKTAIDPFMGQLSYIRILRGTLKAGDTLKNPRSGTNETITSLLQIIGKKQTQQTEAGPGEIVAIPKLKETKTGDTLCASGTEVLPDIDYPQSVMLVSIHAKGQSDEDKLGIAMKRLSDSDPTLKFEKNEETKEIIMKGLGDIHVDVAVALMRQQSNVSVTLTTPQLAYRETISGKGEGHYRHKKQTGGHGQFGEVYLRIMPLKEGEEWFVDKTVGGSIPGNFMPAVEKGLLAGLQKGAVAGYPVQGVRIEVYDGSFHPVDSSEVAFKIAASHALREAITQAKPTLLEPIMQVKITVPENCTGAITSDLNHRRGRVLGMEIEEGLEVITAEVPMAELYQYPMQLRSLTGSRGSFEMEFVRHDIVPTQIAQKVAAARANETALDEE